MDAICAASKLLLVREDADDVGGPFDLFIEVFQRIGRVDLTPMAWWKALPHEHVDLAWAIKSASLAWRSLKTSIRINALASAK